ncbi:M23 family metallopeptidase [Arthrobacter sp. ES3-54]|uniref:M23 family metallopeptidase n=1 Tax=Arthrobacter sp. ES3-54 TaxID=1502991 RepID=UPI002405FF11|nr:M23 family metallopeptidase [Arthrobacter sp. ES3-54]MDF9751259.1 hypothetical protein [Arthrobacter sp. ES3-54]
MKSDNTVRRTTNASSRSPVVAFVAAAIGVALVIVLLVVFSGSDWLHSPDPKNSPDPKSTGVPSAAADELSPITATTLGSSVLPINGSLHAAQRFAIDWIRLDGEGRLVNGDPSNVHSYTAYGADIVAVSGGTVVGALNTLDDQNPGRLPDPSTITLENVLGNHVTVRHSDGRYATYAHMQKGSVTVEVGDSVLPGQTLGKIGNTGNTSAPHLHFQITEGRSVLGSAGLPFVFDRFRLQGQMDAQRWATATTLEGTWNEGLLPSPSPRSSEIPLDVDIIDFGGPALTAATAFPARGRGSTR